MMFAGAKKPHNMRAVAKNQWSEVSCFVKLTKQAAERKMALLDEFSEGGEIIKSCSLYENSDEKKDLVAAQARFETREAEKRLQAALKSRKPDRPDPKTDRPGKVPKLEGDFQSKAGDILFSGPDDKRMPLPRITNKAEIPCAAHYRDGHSCKRGSSCTYSHAPIDKLTPETQKEWIAHVKSTETICFNPKRVKIAAASLKNMKQAEAEKALPEVV